MSRRAVVDEQGNRTFPRFARRWRELTKERAAEQAAARLRAWRELSPLQQLERLDERLGAGKGAAKQRARLRRAPRGRVA